MINSLIVTFSNRDYIPVLANFLAAPGAPNPNDLKVYGLDQETVNFARRSGMQAETLEWGGSFKDLWSARIDVFRNLIKNGKNIIHTDLDAIWLRNPVASWMTGDLDMYFSQGTIHPNAMYEKNGFVLCCGLFSMTASDATVKFLDDLKEDLKDTGDDQASLNEVLMEGRTSWNDSDAPDYRLAMKNHRISCWKDSLVGQSERYALSVGLIPHGIVQRIHDPTDTLGHAHVKHPLSPKNASEKLDLFHDLGLLYIRPDWRKVDTSDGLQSFLKTA